MRTSALLLCAALACSGPTDLDRDAEALLVTDASEYQLVADDWGVQATIRYVFSNRTGRLVSLLNCNGVVPPLVEKLVDGRWVTAWGAAMHDCLSKPIEIRAGAQYRDSLDLWAGHPERNAYPKFVFPDLDGTYRLRWDRAYWAYDHDGPPFGEPVPRRMVVSNAFILRAP